MKFSVRSLVFLGAMLFAANLLAQEPLQPVATKLDKSLGPDGKPWTAESLIAYWRERCPDLNFKIVDRLELDAAAIARLKALDETPQQPAATPAITAPQAPPKLTPREAARARREKELAKRRKSADQKGAAAKPAAPKRGAIVLSEMPPEQVELLDKIALKFNIEPKRVIIDFAESREAAYAQIGSQGREWLLGDRPAEWPGTRPGTMPQREASRAWTLALEVIDFSGNEQAAQVYLDHLPPTLAKRCRPFRWYGVIWSGDEGASQTALWQLNGGAWYRRAPGTFVMWQDEFGDSETITLAPYRGYEKHP